MSLSIVRLSLLSVASAALMSSPVLAMDEAFKPNISGEVSFELENDWQYKSDDTNEEINNLNTTIEPYIKASITENLAVEVGLTFEEIQAHDAGEDSFLDNHGGYVDQLKVTYNRDNYGVEAGKFNPSFGVAWDMAPGVYGVDFAEDYETTGRIGFGGHYAIDGGTSGTHTLRANTFYTDTSALSGATITKLNQTREADGGVGNNGELSNYSVTMDGENVAGVEGLGYHVGYRHQAEGDADAAGTDAQDDYALAAFHTFAINDTTKLFALGEYVHINQLDGGTDDVNYLTTGLQLMFNDHWNIAASHTSRDQNVTGGTDIDDHMTNLSAGYAFDNGIGVDAGWKWAEEANVDTDTFGVLLTYGYEF